MDRRLNLSTDTFHADLVRRVQVLEQRLDLQGTQPRPRSQRYLNPPCCASAAEESTWTYTLDLTGRTLETWTDFEESDGVTFDPLIPASSVITDVAFSGTPVPGIDGFLVRFRGTNPTIEIPDFVIFQLDMEDPTPTPDPALPLAVSDDIYTLSTDVFPFGVENAESTIEDLVLVVTFTSPAIIDPVTDTWPTP